MSTRTIHFAMTPLAACLAAAFSLGSVPAADAAPLFGQTTGVLDYVAIDGSRGQSWKKGASALVESKVTIGDPEAAFALAGMRINGPNGIGKPNAAPQQKGSMDRVASTWVVTNCNDSGTGSLRDIIENVAGSGDTVDLSQLACSEIATVSTAIVAYQESLILQGPGADALTIESSSEVFSLAHGILFHYGTGTLEIDDLTIAGGSRGTSESAAAGGCIYSSGDVLLDHSVVTGCHVDVAGSELFHSVGGGVFAGGDLTMKYSRISDSYIAARSGLRARGGGAYAGGSLTMKYSSLDYNNAAVYGIAGGAWVAGNGGLGTQISNSSINGNQAYAVGALLLAPGESSPNATITNSTIADNSVPQFIGGIKDYVPLQIYNSTISGNHAGLLTDPNTGDPIDAGLFFANTDVVLQSTLMAGNIAGGQAADISKYSVNGSVSGANNLIFAADCAVPSDTIEGVDPLLGDLDPHGGPTPTIDLLPGSPAIDAGNNVNDVPNDQRGPGFSRLVGAAADIGAFESSPAALFITPVDIDFGPVAIGETSHATVTFTNTGSLQLQITNLSNNLSPPFFHDFGNCGVPPVTLAPQSSCHVDYRFEPTAAGSFSAPSFIVTDSVGTFQIDLAGTGDPDIIFRNGFDL